ncbi:MAG TPA: type II secretion system protein GspM [Anaeromyxobacteraceae bacterium]|nr:type II secretion system protein GspM [Anaeromyxobacteraceae bacterium]
MELLRRLWSSAESFFARLAPRERVMVSAALASIALFVLFLASTGVSRAIAARERRVESKTEMLSQLGKLTQGYRQARAERQNLEARLRGPPVQLMSFVSHAGSQMGVEVNDLRPGTPTSAGGLEEDSVEVSLVRIDVAKLARLLDTLERGPGVVKVRKVRLSTRVDDPNLVDATLQVSTWQIKG